MVTETHPRLKRALLWSLAAAALALLAWQGRHLSAWLPALEEWIAGLGAWGPALYVCAALLLTPLLVPDSIFGVTAGVVFGLAAGTLYYFGVVYAVCLLAWLAGRRWLRGPTLRALQARPGLERAMRAARSQGAPLVFWLRLVPVNPVLVSYALGAGDVPFRAVWLGTLGIFPSLFLTAYLGAAAAHMTRMAGESHAKWGIDGLILGLGLLACAGLVLQATRFARREIQAAEVSG